VPLEEYRRKRDFAKTPEPAPGQPADAAAPLLARRRFVVQKHRATRLHYDFRLEIDGVLASWAVPKGPTLDSKIRRMAVHVEDHPMEYFDFEGVIPAKQYGAGDVIVWDWGTWEPEAETPDPRRAIADGELKFVLHGQKHRGRFTIVRTSRRPGSAPSTAFEDDSEQWLLIKKRDADAVAGWDAEDHPQSVKTGRTNDEVQANRDAIWISEQPAGVAEIDLAGAVAKAMPDRVEPMLATLATKPFSDPDWLFEIKWDGYRVQAVVRDGKVKLWTRSLKDGETYFPKLLSPPTWIDAREAIVDGEVVALDEAGRPDFSLLQERISQRRAGSGRGDGAAPIAPVGALAYQVFDLLYLDGRSLLGVPLEDRKRLLRSVLRETPRVRFAGHVVGDGEAFMEAARQQGLEGVVAKLRRSRYEPGRRTPAWLKLKIRPEQELVVGGWTPGEGNARDLGAVAVGVYEDGKLRFAG
jgi:bifunctional non-homologous end joining protein LigD